MDRRNYLFYLSKCKNPKNHIYATRAVLKLRRENLYQKLRDVDEDLLFLDFIEKNLPMLVDPENLWELWVELYVRGKHEGRR